MKSFFIINIFLCLGTVGCLAQSAIPDERLFFCSNQAEYGMNDSIIIDGIVMSTDTTRLPASRYVYVDGFDATDSLCMHVKLRCQADGRFCMKIPSYAARKTGLYHFRAYTRLMLNHPAESLPRIAVRIHGESAETTATGWNCSEDLNQFNLQEATPGFIKSDFTAETHLEITGVAMYRADNRPVKNGSVMAYQRSNQQVYTADTDKNGLFRIPIEDFYTGEEFYLQAYDKNGKDHPCIFTLDEEPIPSFSSTSVAIEKLMGDDFSNENPKRGLFQVNVLPEVTVRSHRKFENIEKERKKFYKLHLLTREDLDNYHFIDLYDIVQHFSSYMYLWQSHDNEELMPEGEIYLRSRRESLLGEKGTPVKIVVNGVEWSFQELANNLNFYDIEEIEYKTPGETLGVPNLRFAIGGALVFKIRDGKPGKSPVSSKGQIFVMKGLDDLL